MELKDRLALTAIHMKQANVGLAVKSLFGQTINEYDYRGVEINDDGSTFQMIGQHASTRLYNGGCAKDYALAYISCPPLSAIINRKAQAFANGKTWVLDTKGSKKGQESTNANANKLRKLLANPNVLQTWKQFETQQYIYTQLFGYCVVLIQKPVGFSNIDATALWNIPPHLCTIEEEEGLFFRKGNKGIKRITVGYGGEQADLNLDNVFVMRDIMPSFKTVIIPDSRVSTLTMPINNILGAYESRNMLINSRGALGMITNQTQDSFSGIPLKKGEKEDLLTDFQRLYGLRQGQSHVIISSANLKWQSMVLPTKDLMLFEEIEDDANRICHTFNVPPELYSQMSKGTNTSNTQTLSRNLYQDAIIPEADSYFEQWNKMFDTDSYGITLDRDYTHLAVLQPDAKAEAESRLRRNQALQIEFRNDIITMNQWRKFNNDDPIEGGDLYYSEIKDRLSTSYNAGMSPTSLDQTFVEDNLNPRDLTGDAANINPNG